MTHISHSLRRWRFASSVSIAAWCAAMAGCGGNELPPESDADRACEALKIALDAWKNGEDLDALKDRDPPISFKDMSLMRGASLEDYTLDDKTERSGLSILCTATLTVRDAQGKTSQRQATYTIDTQGAIVIVPGDF
jgi:hypothetical protein